MIALLQRVKSASVMVSKKTISNIGLGVLVLLGVKEDDTQEDIDYLVNKISSLKIFPKEERHFALSIKEQNAEILLVSQFTLYGNFKKGSKPSFTNAMNGPDAKNLYLEFGRKLDEKGFNISYGEFGAYMQIEMVNDGPVSLILTSDHLKDKNKI